MAALSHLLAVLAYAAAAAALPVLVPQLAWPHATALGAGVFIACGLLHEVAARLARQRRLAGGLARLEGDQAALRDELAAARRELQGLFEALEAHGPAARPGGEASLGEIRAEVRMLRGLVAKLSGAPLAGDPPAAVGAPRAAEPLDEGAVLEALRGSLREDRIEVVLQPIVSLPQRKRRYYECFTRIRGAEGDLLPAESYIAMAEREGLVTAVDNMLLFRCVQLVRRIQRRRASLGFVCNISPRSLADGDFFAEFVGFLESNPELASDLVFEFAQADLESLPPAATGHLQRLGRLGCRFSVDQVRTLAVDAAALRQRRVRFLKVEAATLYEQVAAEGLKAARRWKGELDRVGIDLVVEKVEDEQMLVELLDLGIDFGQGYLFGAPRLLRPEDEAEAA